MGTYLTWPPLELNSRRSRQTWTDAFYLDNLRWQAINSCPVKQSVEDDARVWSVMLPGVPAENIQIEFLNKKVVVKAKNDNESHNYSFYVGDINPEHVEATCKDGVLKVRVPNEKEQNTIKIEIKT